MIDFHSHILPNIDDGSQSVEESCELLRMLAAQDVDTVAATSHFYRHEHDVKTFLEKRQQAYERLLAEKPESGPKILLGAEVYYYAGISRLEGLVDLRLEGSRLLLLEMPFETWTEYTVREVLDLSRSGELIVLLAHIERYLPFQKREVWERLLQNDILMQVNASFFLSLRTRRKALRLLRDGRIHVLGSDCHNIEVRKPRIDEAAAVIRGKSRDGSLLEQIESCGRWLLGGEAN